MPENQDRRREAARSNPGDPTDWEDNPEFDRRVEEAKRQAAAKSLQPQGDE